MPHADSPTGPDTLASRAAVTATLRAAGCVFAEDEAELIVRAAGSPDELAAMVDRRAGGLPLEHVLGWAEFCGRRIEVDPGVFVPRHRTEHLVRLGISLAREARPADRAHRADRAHHGRPVLVDLCCGSGAVGAVLAAAVPGAELYAADIDPAAVRCARRNLAPFGGRVHQGDLYEPLPAALRGRIAVLAANVPYVPTEDTELLPPEAREHEPRRALDGGADGLDVLRRVAAGAPDWLAPGGALLVETSERQAPRAVEVFEDSGLIARLSEDAELYATVVVGTRPPLRTDPPRHTNPTPGEA